MLRIILDETVLERNNCNLSEKVYIRSKINLLKVDQVDFKNCVFIDCNFVSEPRNFVPGPIINCAFYDCRRNGEYFSFGGFGNYIFGCYSGGKPQAFIDHAVPAKAYANIF